MTIALDAHSLAWYHLMWRTSRSVKAVIPAARQIRWRCSVLIVWRRYMPCLHKKWRMDAHGSASRSYPYIYIYMCTWFDVGIYIYRRLSRNAALDMRWKVEHWFSLALSLTHTQTHLYDIKMSLSLDRIQSKINYFCPMKKGCSRSTCVCIIYIYIYTVVRQQRRRLHTLPRTVASGAGDGGVIDASKAWAWTVTIAGGCGRACCRV